MEAIKDITKAKKEILASIERFGFLPEHNYYHYLYRQSSKKKCIFFDFGQQKGLMALLNPEINVWYVTCELLAPESERLELFMEFLEHAFTKEKAKKVSVEFGEAFKEKVCEAVKKSDFKTSMNFELYWPVCNVGAWDENLRGKEWKKFRNIRNRFMNSFKIEIEDPKKLDKKILKSVLTAWLKHRHPRDRVDYKYYLNLIENNLEGFDMARSLSFDGEVCSISAGWKIPNSSAFYLGIGIFNYRHKDMGDFINLDDLLHLKKLGYTKIDLGGSDKAILNFKNKFNPEKVYKTCIFSILRKR